MRKSAASASASASSNSKSIEINGVTFGSDELENALIFLKINNGNDSTLAGITNGKIKKAKDGAKYLKLYSFLGPKNIILGEEIAKIIKPVDNNPTYKSLLNSLIKTPGTINKLAPINPPQIFAPAPPLKPAAEGSRSRRKTKAQAPQAQSAADEKKDRSRKRVEITVEQLREHLERKFNGFATIDDIFAYIKQRFTKEDLSRFLLKQVKADLELML